MQIQPAAQSLKEAELPQLDLGDGEFLPDRTQDIHPDPNAAPTDTTTVEQSAEPTSEATEHQAVPTLQRPQPLFSTRSLW